ncbi:MAG: YcxB family protein [Ruminococcus sp.]|nr:YcxB family protein [Ruminococcus sp.]
MEKNLKLEKTYKISADIFRDGMTAYQKKYVYPKSYVFMCVFLVFTANFVYGAVKAPDNLLAYLLVVVCLALAIREWYNPRKMKRNILDTLRQMGESEYNIIIGEGFVEFSTIQRGDVENSDDETIPPTRIQTGENIQILEYDRFFLLIDNKAVYYILPKEYFSEDEMEIIRSLDSK